MTIRKGEPWGHPSVIDDSTMLVDSDAALARHPGQVVSLTAGHLHDVLGNPEPKAQGDACLVLPIDGLECEILHGGTAFRTVAVADVVVGTWWGQGSFRVITNGGLLRGRNVAPRAHPNDGKWDAMTVDPAMSLRDRVAARRRSRTGTHVPHPHIRVEGFSEMVVRREGRQTLVIDGVRIASWDTAVLRVQPDMFTVAV